MNPRDFLSVAVDLTRKDGPTPVDLRSAVSRAYYALFDTALECLATVGLIVLDNQQGHRQVPLALRSAGDSQLRAIAATLDAAPHAGRRTTI